MVAPKPPCARSVSQLYSSSESVPSTWLCRLVSGASMKRFFRPGPRVNEIGSNRDVMVAGVFLRI